MTHDFDGFADEPRFERFTPTHAATAVDDLDPSFVFDFQAYDDLESDTQRWSTWLSVEPLCRGPEPRPDWVVTSAGRHRHRARHPEDRQGGRRLPPRARRARRAVRGDGRQALPRRGDPLLPPQRRLHRGPQDPALPRRPGDGQEVHLRARPSPPASGPGPSGRRSSGCGCSGVPVPYPVQIDGTEILMEFVTVDGDGGAPAGADPAGAGAAGVLLRAAPGGDGRAGPARARPRRPLAVQHPRGGRPAGDHRPAADGGPGRQPAGRWTSCCATAPTSAAGSGPAGWRSTSTSCTASCSRTPGGPGAGSAPPAAHHLWISPVTTGFDDGIRGVRGCRPRRLAPMNATPTGGPGLPQERRLVTEIPGPESRGPAGAQEAVRRRRRRHRAAGLRHRGRRRRPAVDVDGNSLIDLGSGIAVTTVGNAAPAVVERVHRAGGGVHPHLLHGHAVRRLRRRVRGARRADPGRPRRRSRRCSTPAPRRSRTRSRSPASPPAATRSRSSTTPTTAAPT